MNGGTRRSASTPVGFTGDQAFGRAIAEGVPTVTRSGHTASFGIRFKRCVFFKIKNISFMHEKIADLLLLRILDSRSPRGDGGTRFRASANRESEPGGITCLRRDTRRGAGSRAAALEPHPREGRKESRCV